jgi:hypothetical protein
MAHTTNYAILRLTPDSARGETVNVGIVVFLPDRLDVRVLPSSAKIRAINPNAPIDQLYALPELFNKLFGPVADDSTRLQMMRNFPVVEISDMGRFASEARPYEDQVQALLDRFVKTPPRKKSTEKTSKLDLELRKAFQASRLLGEESGDIGRHLVVPNFAISEPEQLYADFALKNGRWHITATVDFRVARASIKGAKRGQAALKAVTLDSAVRRFGSANTVPLAVYTANDEDRDLIEPQLAMLGDYSERVFDFSSADERAAYMEHMVQAARSH